MALVDRLRTRAWSLLGGHSDYVDLGSLEEMRLNDTLLLLFSRWIDSGRT